MGFWDEKEAKRLFQELLFYNVPIEKPYTTRLNNIDLLHELTFYNKLGIVKTPKAFKEYARSYNIELIDSKDPSIQLTISKSSLINLFKDLLDEIKGLKYQMTLKVLLSKYKEKTDREFTPVYFNSTTKTIINSRYDLDKSFQEIFPRIDNWIREGSGRIIESIGGEYVNISYESPLPVIQYIYSIT